MGFGIIGIVNKVESTKQEFATVGCVVLLALLGVSHAAAGVFARDAAVELVTDCFRFTEGPAANAAGDLYFSDMKAGDSNTLVFVWSASNTLSLFCTNTGGCNGLYFWTNGTVYACEGGAQRVTIIDMNRNLAVLVSNYNGKPFYRPNDLWVDPKGGVYFTDPSWSVGGTTQKIFNVYYVPSGTNCARRVTYDLFRPNGVVGTPDGQRLYVSDSGSNRVFTYAIRPDGTLTNKTLFSTITCDGMTLDDAGNVYLTDTLGANQHVTVLDEDGRWLASVRIPFEPTHCERGGAGGNTLFVTANRGGVETNMLGCLYRIALSQNFSYRQGLRGYRHLGAMLVSGYPNDNFGGGDEMRVGYDPALGTLRAVLSFTISNVWCITNVTLKVRTHESNSGALRQLELHRVRAAMTEGTGSWGIASGGVTWQNARDGVPWSNPGGDYDAAPLAVVTGMFAGPDTVICFTATPELLRAAQEALAGRTPLALIICAASSGTNQLVVGSNNHANARFRPLLILDDAPYQSAPPNGAQGQPLTPELVSTFYLVDSNDTHTVCRWQVSTMSNFAGVAWDSGATNAVRIEVAEHMLQYSTRYFWRLQCEGTDSNWSEWASPWSFQTREPDFVPPDGPTNPIGVARGIFPGRIAWVRHPFAAYWSGATNDGFWWQSNFTSQPAVDDMLQAALGALTGAASDSQAWAALFLHFNQTHDRGAHGYSSGETVAIKANYVGCSAGNGYSSTHRFMHAAMTSPQMTLALLRQLVHQAGVPASNIVLYDSSPLIGDFVYNACYPEFPALHYVDRLGLNGRERALPDTNNPIYCSNGSVTQFPPAQVTAADYLINLAALKSHEAASGGGGPEDFDTKAEFVSLCGKNHFGSLCGSARAYHPFIEATNKYATYHVLVDLMGHRHLGGKTLLSMIDGLYGGLGHWDAIPRLWLTPPFNSNWPSSVLLSQDGCAIDSVGLDLIRTERAAHLEPLSGSVDLYLHEAATAGNPASGVFYDPERDGVRLASLGVHEHWDNETSQRYTRDLNPTATNGIELVRVTLPEPGWLLWACAALAGARRAGSDRKAG